MDRSLAKLVSLSNGVACPVEDGTLSITGDHVILVFFVRNPSSGALVGNIFTFGALTLLLVDLIFVQGANHDVFSSCGGKLLFTGWRPG